MRPIHTWDIGPAEAMALQSTLRGRLTLRWDRKAVTRVGGIDVAFTENRARAAIVVLSFPQMAVLEVQAAETSVTFPYRPGLLAFREGPAILAAWELLNATPDLLMFDGQGIAHPRGLGLASHMGLWLEVPSVGVAKSRLYGDHTAPGGQRGDLAYLYDPDDPRSVIGAALRTRSGVRPVYVSPGHLIDLPTSIRFVLECTSGYRIPEPIRLAHVLASSGETRKGPR